MSEVKGPRMRQHGKAVSQKTKVRNPLDPIVAIVDEGRVELGKLRCLRHDEESTGKSEKDRPRLLIDVVPTEERSRLIVRRKRLPPQIGVFLRVSTMRHPCIETLVSQVFAATESQTPGDVSFGETRVCFRST